MATTHHQHDWQAQCGFTKGKRVLPAEETHSAEPEFVSLSDKGQEIEDKDNDQESEAQILQRRKPTRNQRMIEEEAPERRTTPDPESPTGTEAQQTQEASPGRSTQEGERRSTRANRGKLRSTENKWINIREPSSKARRRRTFGGRNFLL
jgi:hypothetical protein